MARDFTGGSSDRIDIGTFSVVSTGFTMACWLFIDSFSDGRDERYISKADGTGTANHDWMLGKTINTAPSGGGNLRARLNRQTNTTFGATNLPTGQWFHAAVTYNNGSVVIYYNGISDGSGTHGSGNLPNNTDAVYIGNQPTATSNAPDGRIAHVGIWSRALSADELRSLALGAHPFQLVDGLVRYYPIFGNESPEPDYSGNGAAGTVTGTSAIDGPPVSWVRGPSKIFLPVAAAGGGSNQPCTLMLCGVGA